MPPSQLFGSLGLRLCVAALLAPTALAFPNADDESPQNVLLIVADDVGVDSIDAYGVSQFRVKTPNLDRLAEEGLLFRNVWSNPVCSSTRALLQTGRYSFRTGIGVIVNANGNGWALDLGETTLPEVFDAHPHLNIAHALIGKWHLNNQTNGGILSPNLAGYDHYVGALDNLAGQKGFFQWPLVINGVERAEIKYATQVEVDRALEWIDSTSEPWFLHLGFHTAHNPFHAPPPGTHTGRFPDAEPREEPRPYYRAMVENMDGEIQRLLDGLGEARGRTNVIFIGDNGTPFEVIPPPLPMSHGKISPYELGIQVPLIVQGPMVEQPGRVVEHLVAAVDIFPTVLEMMKIDPVDGLPADLKIDGMSLAPYLREAAAEPMRDILFSEMFSPNGPFQEESEKEVVWRMTRDLRYKLIQRRVEQNFVEEFYDLRLDPFEQNNLIDNILDLQQRAALEELQRQVTLISQS